MRLYLRPFFVLFLRTWHSWQMTSWMWTNIYFESMDDWHYKLYISYQSWYESLILFYYRFKQAFFIFHDKHYDLYISYQRWYESLLFPLWIITRGHFYGFCVNDNTYTVRFSENAWRSCCNFQKGCPYPRFHCTVSRCAHLECPRCAHLLTLSVLFTPY